MSAEDMSAFVRDDGPQLFLGKQVDDSRVHDDEWLGVTVCVGIRNRIHFKEHFRLRYLKRFARFLQDGVKVGELRRPELDLRSHVNAMHHVLCDGLHEFLHEHVKPRDCL